MNYSIGRFSFETEDEYKEALEELKVIKDFYKKYDVVNNADDARAVLELLSTNKIIFSSSIGRSFLDVLLKTAGQEEIKKKSQRIEPKEHNSASHKSKSKTIIKLTLYVLIVGVVSVISIVGTMLYMKDKEGEQAIPTDNWEMEEKEIASNGNIETVDSFEEDEKVVVGKNEKEDIAELTVEDFEDSLPLDSIMAAIEIFYDEEEPEYLGIQYNANWEEYEFIIKGNDVFYFVGVESGFLRMSESQNGEQRAGGNLWTAYTEYSKSPEDFASDFVYAICEGESDINDFVDLSYVYEYPVENDNPDSIVLNENMIAKNSFKLMKAVAFLKSCKIVHQIDGYSYNFYDFESMQYFDEYGFEWAAVKCKLSFDICCDDDVDMEAFSEYKNLSLSFVMRKSEYKWDLIMFFF